MNNRLKLAAALLALLISIIACVTSPVSTPKSVEIGTIVAQTMQALTPNAPTENTSTSAPPSEAPSLLPHSLYYLNTDSAGFVQVYRLEKDGSNIQQITFELSDVKFYDVSPIDGSVAYTSNNQLLLVNADGSGRRVLVDGGPLSSDETYYTSAVGGVAWSPDGQTISFGQGGLKFYALKSGAINQVLENQIDSTAGFPILREGYNPLQYAPDGDKVLINIGYYEGGAFAIYFINGKTLMRSKENPVSCCEGSWNPDGTAYYAASPFLGMIAPGMWRINLDGSVDTLIPGDAGGGSFNFASDPVFGSDGNLYFFYGMQTDTVNLPSRVPLKMVRSAPDGVTDRTDLVSTPYENINEILWAPDASFAIIAMPPVENIYQGGRAEIQYTDGRPPVTLVPFAMDMRWGP